LPQDRAECSAWAPSLPASLLRQSARSAVPHRSVLASQAALHLHQRPFAKSARHDQPHVAMHQYREQLRHRVLRAQRNAVIAAHDLNAHRAQSARRVRIARHESDASAARQRQR
jgi:hypothetical protein